MTPKMTEDQIIEEAVRLTEADMRYLTHSDYAEIAARIIALEAEIERLKAAFSRILLSPDVVTAFTEARQALGDKND